MAETEEEQLTLTVTINGTDANPHHIMGLTANPFPQLGIREFTPAERAVAALDGDPIRGEADIRARLAGFSTEFVDLCIANWQPGKRVAFQVTFPRSRHTQNGLGAVSAGPTRSHRPGGDRAAGAARAPGTAGSGTNGGNDRTGGPGRPAG